MTNSVTFPVALGGDGKTYTDDADPETGLDGLGYTTRLIPMFSAAVGMMVYSSQYFLAINEAKANADRAEDAKRYVEAVAEAYKVNLLEQFKRDATLGLDFIKGQFWRDDGERFETTDPSEFFSIGGGGEKYTEAPTGALRLNPANTLARQWFGGVPQGALFNREFENLFRFSESFESWSMGGNNTVIPNAAIAPNGQMTADRLEATTDGSTIRYVGQPISTTTGRYTWSGYLKPDQAEWFRIRPPSGAESYFNVRTFEKNVATGDKVTLFRLRNGWVRFFYEFDGVGETESVYIYMHTGSDGVTSNLSTGDGVYLWGFCVVEGAGYHPYIPSPDATAITRAADAVSVQASGVKSVTNFTVFLEARIDSSYHTTDYLFFINDDAGTSPPWFGLGWWSGSLRLRSDNNADIIASYGNPVGDYKIAISVDGGDYIMSINGQSSFGKGAPIAGNVGDIIKLAHASSVIGSRHSSAWRGFYICPRSLTESKLDGLTL